MTAPFMIGELARRSGRSIHTIRWYETQGLMPGVRRDSGGRRLYTEGHVGWLEFIERLRTSGMSIAQMREYAGLVKRGRASLRERLALLQAHQEGVRARMKVLKQALQILHAKRAYYERWMASDEPPPPFDVSSALSRSRSRR